MLDFDIGEVRSEADVDYSPQGKYIVKDPASTMQHIADTEPPPQNSDPLHGLQPWCLQHVYGLWAVLEHGKRLAHVREVNGAVGRGIPPY